MRLNDSSPRLPATLQPSLGNCQPSAATTTGKVLSAELSHNVSNTTGANIATTSMMIDIDNKSVTSSSNSNNNDSMKSNDSNNNSINKNAGVPFYFTRQNAKLAFLLLLTLPLYLMADQEVISTNPMTIGSRKHVSSDDGVGGLAWAAKGGAFSNSNKEQLLVSGGIEFDGNNDFSKLLTNHEGNNDAVATALMEWKDARAKTEAKASEVAMTMERIRASTDLALASAMVAAKISYDEHLILKHREETLVAKFLATLRGQMEESNGGPPPAGAFTSYSNDDDDNGDPITPSMENNTTVDDKVSTDSAVCESSSDKALPTVAKVDNPPRHSFWVATKAKVIFGFVTVITNSVRAVGFVTSFIGACVFFCFSFLSAIAGCVGFALYVGTKVWGVPPNSVCATKIQARVRGWITRRNMKMKNSVMTCIQANVRGWMDRRLLERASKTGAVVNLRQETFEAAEAAAQSEHRIEETVFDYSVEPDGTPTDEQKDAHYK